VLGKLEISFETSAHTVGQAFPVLKLCDGCQQNTANAAQC